MGKTIHLEGDTYVAANPETGDRARIVATLPIMEQSAPMLYDSDVSGQLMTIDLFEDVGEFHRRGKVSELPQIGFPGQAVIDLRKRLNTEEVTETNNALDARDMVESTDGAIDSIYVLIGCLRQLGVSRDCFKDLWNEVQRSNLEKFVRDEHGEWTFYKDAGGKITKPPGWKKPDIAGVLYKHGYVVPKCEACDGTGDIPNGTDQMACGACGGSGERHMQKPIQSPPVTALPDGSGFFTASLPLPKDHWLYVENLDHDPPAPMRMGNSPVRSELAKKITWAARYAIRGATMCGKEKNWDPDSLIQNLIVGLLGYWTEDGK